MNAAPIKRAPTLFLKAVIVVIGALVITLCAFVFPVMYRELHSDPRLVYVVYPGLAGFYASIVPFLLALFQALKLLQYIDRNAAFSDASVTALGNIKYCAIAMSALYALALPLAYLFAELDDAPGLILISTAFAFAPLVVATFAAVLQKLVRSAVEMKAEHDLTV